MCELKVIKSYVTTFDDYHNDMLLVSHTKETYASAKQIECYLKSEADKAIAELEESHKMEVEQLLMEIVKLKKEIESMKVKFREFNDNVCKKIVDASRMMSTISQDAQMDFYEEFIKEAK